MNIRMVLATLLTLLTSAGYAADCVYEVRGRVMVEHDQVEMIDTLGTTSPLENIEVKISTQAQVLGAWGWFSPWPNTVRTDENGEFVSQRTFNCQNRRVKVRVKFRDASLELRHQTSTQSTTKVKWYEIFQQVNGHYSSAFNAIDLGTKTFRIGGPGDLGKFEARRHADLWVFTRLVMDKMDHFGFPFTSQLKIKYPHDGIVGDFSETSYANPATQVIYLHKESNGGWDVWEHPKTVIHELMHAWLYDYSTGELVLAAYLALNGTTHGWVTNSSVAFYEGFAEYAAKVLMGRIFDADIKHPLSRAYWDSTFVEELPFRDTGWETIFGVIHLGVSPKYIFSTDESRIEDRPFGLTPICPSGKNVNFKRLLRVMNGRSGTAFPDVISASEMNLTDFMTRMIEVLNAIEAADANLLQDLFDPTSNFEPLDECYGFGNPHPHP